MKLRKSEPSESFISDTVIQPIQCYAIDAYVGNMGHVGSGGPGGRKVSSIHTFFSFMQLVCNSYILLLHATSSCVLLIPHIHAPSCIYEASGMEITISPPFSLASQSTSTTLVPNMIGQVRRNPGTPDLESCRSIRNCFSSVTADLPA